MPRNQPERFNLSMTTGVFLLVGFIAARHLEIVTSDGLVFGGVLSGLVLMVVGLISEQPPREQQ